jgi:MYXO-CTERM domain-containing protein
VLGAVGFGSSAAHAHFVLQSPAAAHEQDAYGDPQKAPPCGDNGGAVPTGMVSAYQAGGTITITIDETIFHPGHYRIALAVNDISELPAEPPVTPNNTPCGTVPIMDPPVFPVLADGVFAHDASFNEPQSIDIPVPDGVNCDNCTLQIIQFMSNHGLNNPGGCFYHHCAMISVSGDPVETSTTDDTASSGGEVTTATTATTNTSQGSTGGEMTADGTGIGSTGGGATEGSPTSDGSMTGTGGGPTTPSTMTDGATTAPDDDGEGGCACSAARDGEGLATLAGLLGLLGLRARRSRA